MTVIGSSGGGAISTDFGAEISEGSVTGTNQGPGAWLTFTVTLSSALYEDLVWRVLPVTGHAADFWSATGGVGPPGASATGSELFGLISFRDNVGTFKLQLNADRFDEENEVFEVQLGTDVRQLYSGGPFVATGRFTIIDDDVYGTSGNDKMFGDGGDNTIFGLEGNDVIKGRAGSDRVYGGSGNDQLFGGKGMDLLSGGEGNDKLAGGANPDTLYGGSGNDTLQAGKGADVLYGESGDDFLDGGRTADILYGGSGRDTLIGGSGEDQLYGGEGDDVLTGGGGRDTFYFFKDVAGEHDVVTDFTDRRDKISISGLSGTTTEKWAAITVSSHADGTLVAWQDRSVLLEGVAADRITVDDFLLT